MSPFAAHKFCAHVGCHAYALPGSDYCLAHQGSRQRAYDKARQNDPSHMFYLSPAWKALREQYLSMHPLCELCEQEGRVTVATICHHRVEVTERPDLALDMSNLEALCPACHNTVHGRLKGGSHEE